MIRWFVALILTALFPQTALSGDRPARDASISAENTPPAFRAGVAERDITPSGPTPMWGYGARHDRLSNGVIDRLKAKALVLEAGPEKLAIVGLDLGRAPTPTMMGQIRNAVATRGIRHVLINGSHTHHGPVIELSDRPGFGKGKFDPAVAYATKLPALITEAILEADGKCQPARIGSAHRELEMNRNRHSKRPVKPRDPRLTVIRLDRTDGSPIAALIHFAAHPVMTPGEVLKFSADYPGFLRGQVEKDLGAPCVFIQGAAGDQSPNPSNGRREPRSFGEALGEQALKLARGIVTAVPQHPSIAATVDRFRFATRMNLKNPLNSMLYSRAFFPELIQNVFEEYADGMVAEFTTVVINGDIAIVGLPGEPFSQHATRFRERADIPTALIFGYCNGHLLYFPTIEAASEGGYGADPRMSPIALGAGEAMIDRALINLYRLTGKFVGEPQVSLPQAIAASTRGQVGVPATRP